jgi:hypothetical protein
MASISQAEVDRIAAEVGPFVSALLNESERAAVVLGTARVDASLESCLKAVLRRHPGGSDDLFEPERPCGTFGAKIALAYRLGLIDSDFEHALQMLRRIRNDFAHAVTRVSLSDGASRGRLLELVRTTGGSRLHTYLEGAVRSAVSNHAYRLSEEGVTFGIAMGIILTVMEIVGRASEMLTPASTARFRDFGVEVKGEPSNDLGTS